MNIKGIEIEIEKEEEEEEEAMGLRQTLLNMPHPSSLTHSLRGLRILSLPFFALLNPAWLPTNQPTTHTHSHKKKEERKKERKKKK